MTGASVTREHDDMSIDDWNIKDINSDKELDTIEPLPARARSLLIRNRGKPLLKQYGFLNVLGAVEMLEGLEYHHGNIVRISSSLAKGDPVSAIDVDHEALAYINRLGQFFYFAKSEFVRGVIQDAAAFIPTISKFLVFRHKHSAHRSIDLPRGESESEKVAHVRALSSMMGSLFSPRPNMPTMKLPEVGIPIDPEEITRNLWKHNYRTFQTFDSSSDSHVNFTAEVEHPKIMEEAYSVVQRVILHE